MEEKSKDAAPARPRRGWQRVTPQQKQSHETRETFRRDAPSPAQEILAKHDASLEEQRDQDNFDEDDDCTAFCF